MVKTFEKEGETYIVSEGAEELDTEALVDKSILQKTIERVEKAITATTIASTQVKEQEYIGDKNLINIIFVFQTKDGEPFSIAGTLESYKFNTTASYEILVPITDFIKIPFQLESKNLLKVNSVSLFLVNQAEMSQETAFRYVKSFAAQKHDNSKWVRCSIEISTM